jgi:hypothetical protein
MIENYFMNIEDLICYIITNWMKVEVETKISESYDT